jgi:hypothetical protein
MFAESLLSEQDFCPKTGGRFSEILLSHPRPETTAFKLWPAIW